MNLDITVDEKELAKIIGTTPATLSKYENGIWTINQAVTDTIFEKYGEQIRPIGTRSAGRKVWKKRGE